MRDAALVGLLGLLSVGCTSSPAPSSRASIEADCRRLRSTHADCLDRCSPDSIDLTICDDQLDALPASVSAMFDDCLDAPCPAEDWCAHGWYTCSCIAACAEAGGPALVEAYGTYMRCWADQAVASCP